YEEYGLTEDLLMEHAAEGMAQAIRERFAAGASILIAAGPGNNGADGITLARLLQGRYDVRLYLPLGAKSSMAKVQLERTRKVGVSESDAIGEADVVVDALFGAGLSRPLSEEIAQTVEAMNALEGFKLACDIPTGLDERGWPSPTAFRAEMTVTMGALKEALYLDAAKEYVGEIRCVDLGVERSLYEEESRSFLLEKEDFLPPLRARRPAAHKGSFGHAAVFCGEKPGAGIMAASAAARFGAGLTTLVVHEQVEAPPFLMRATTVPDKASAIAIGPGLGDFFETEMLESQVVDSSLPVVLDADALARPDLLEILHQRRRKIVLTPHPAEFTRLWKIVMKEELSVEEVQRERFELARRFSARFPHVVLLLKGANPILAHLGELYVNPLGSVALAKGGSGDVLSGLIVALLAQGYEALDAAIQGSLALALAAQRYEGADYSMLPTDLIEELREEFFL
ncbi:NAD(P)H-hydrate dehydratase, partial [Nitratifractor sp.]|uniref:NAD(P)H-hydrate dehydratase n=1 Tax=Nitratifractor sp. TaxID=2268144 RepID=UPI0025F3C8F9